MTKFFLVLLFFLVFQVFVKCKGTLLLTDELPTLLAVSEGVENTFSGLKKKKKKPVCGNGIFN